MGTRYHPTYYLSLWVLPDHNYLIFHTCFLCISMYTARKIPFMYSFSGIARPQSQFPHSCVCSQDRSTYFPTTEWANRSWKYINFSQIYECRNWETEPYNSVLEIKVSFLGIHKWEPDIYIGFSPALHLQCICRYDDPVQLPADGDLGAGLDGGALQGHVHEGRSHQKSKPNQTKPEKN